METQSDTLKEILSDLFALLEAQETNSTAVLQLLKDQGIASDEKLSTYLYQAGKASNVKWRARMRTEYLLTPIRKKLQAVISPNNQSPKNRSLQKRLTNWKKSSVTIKQKTTQGKRTKASLNQIRQQRHRRSPGIQSETPATVPQRTTSTPQVSKPHSRCFAHPFTNLHRLLTKIRLTP